MKAAAQCHRKALGNALGKEKLDELRKILLSLLHQIPFNLPDYLPVLGYGLFSKGSFPARQDEMSSHLLLITLLSQLLLAFAIEDEHESDVSLAISANLLRVLSENYLRLRDLPFLTGISKEAISVAMGILQNKHLGVIEADQTGSGAKLVRLTPRSRRAQDAYRQLLKRIEEGWHTRLAKQQSASFGTRSNCRFASPSPTRIIGAHPSANPVHCRTIPWCCIAVDSRTVVKASLLS